MKFEWYERPKECEETKPGQLRNDESMKLTKRKTEEVNKERIQRDSHGEMTLLSPQCEVWAVVRYRDMFCRRATIRGFRVILYLAAITRAFFARYINRNLRIESVETEKQSRNKRT
jgi:hypothetical protein